MFGGEPAPASVLTLEEARAMAEIHRFGSPDELADGVARQLLSALVARQAGGAITHLCLTGGRIANRMYARLGGLVEGSGLDPGRMELWWGDERFLPTDDPDRNAGPTLALLAGKFPLDPARTHPMPSADGVADNAASAATYAKELDDATFDICLLGMGEDGHVASIFPAHPSFEATPHAVIAVNDAPKPPPERISLSLGSLCRSREVWFIVSGAAKADALSRAVLGDPTLPAGVARGVERTVWFVDVDAAAKLPYHRCAF